MKRHNILNLLPRRMSVPPVDDPERLDRTVSIQRRSASRGCSSGLIDQRRALCSIFIGFFLFCSGSVFAQEGPEISLDTTELVSDIRATRTVATDVESSLAEALATVASQTKQLQSAGCEPESTSAECRNLKSKLREDYLGVLNNVETRLPALRSAVEKVVANIELRMGRQAGATASDVQEELVQSQGGQGGKQRLAMQGVSGSRLSESLGRLQQLVSTTQSSGASFRTIQSDLYLDMRESLGVIENLNADIQRTRILAELQLGDMQVGDEEQQIARDARRYLFGDSDNQAPVVPGPAVPIQPTGDPGRSPLEL